MTHSTPAPSSLPVLIVGAGPVGLVAAAHLVARGETPLVLEMGSVAGAGVARWDHVQMFSRWGTLLDPVGVSLLRETGWTPPDPNGVPTGRELRELWLEPLADLPGVREALHLGHRVVAAGRLGMDRTSGGAGPSGRARVPFQVRVRREADGGDLQFAGRALLDASGTFHRPNPLGKGGWPAPGEDALGPRLYPGQIPRLDGPEGRDLAGRHTLVVGAGHSAMHAALGLAELAERAPGTRVTWAVRGPSLPGEGAVSGCGGGGIRSLRAELEANARKLFYNSHVEILTDTSVEGFLPGDRVGVDVLSGGTLRTLEVDRVVALTGGRPQLDFLEELRLSLDPRLQCAAALAPFIDPDVHTCDTVPLHGVDDLVHPEEPDAFLLGMKSFGRAPGFLLSTGHEQVRSVVDHLVQGRPSPPEAGTRPPPRERAKAAPTCC